MIAIRNRSTCVRRLGALGTIQFLALAVITVGFSAPAHGALLLSGTQYSLRYDGQVRNAAGTAFGEEGHANPSITFNATATDVNANVSPSPPLAAAKTLTVTETEFNAPMSKTQVVIDIHGKGDPVVFNNMLDPNFLVEFEAFFVSNDSTKGLSIDVNDPAAIRVENFGVFHQLPTPPNVKQVSGLGTVASPLRLFLGISPSLLPTDNGRVKVHFLYSTVNIPEPASASILALGLVGIAGTARRRR